MDVGIFRDKFIQDIRGAVRGIIIHDNNVKWEISFLPESTHQSVGNRLFTVKHGNDDACFPLKEILFFVCAFCTRRQVRPNALQMICRNFFELPLTN